MSTPVPPYPMGAGRVMAHSAMAGSKPQGTCKIQHFYLTRQGQTLPEESLGLILCTSQKKNKLCFPQGKLLLPFAENCSCHYNLEQGTEVRKLVLHTQPFHLLWKTYPNLAKQ